MNIKDSATPIVGALALTLCVSAASPSVAFDGGAVSKSSTGGSPASATEGSERIADGLTQYSSLSAAEEAAAPGEAIAYAPSSGNAVVIEKKGIGGRAGGSMSAVSADFSVDCPGDGSAPERIIDQYNAAYLGTTLLKCGNSKSGYEHISSRHGQEWQNRITAVGSQENWAEFMMWVSKQAFESPLPDTQRSVSKTIRFATPRR